MQLIAGALVVAILGLGGTRVEAKPRVGIYQSSHATQDPSGAIEVWRLRSKKKELVRIDSTPVAHLSAHVYSVVNGNRAYRAEFGVPKRLDTKDTFLYLGNGLVIPATSSGSGNGKFNIGFRLDRAQATRVARALGVPRQDRRNLARGLRHGCGLREPKAHPQVGPIVVEFWAKSSRRVDAELGGRNRGPRNDRFAFEIRRKGKKVPTREAMNFGGRSTMRRLGPGHDKFEDSADLRAWAELSEPGLYRVRCMYELMLFEPGKGHKNWPTNAHRTWETEATNSFTLRVR